MTFPPPCGHVLDNFSWFRRCCVARSKPTSNYRAASSSLIYALTVGFTIGSQIIKLLKVFRRCWSETWHILLIKFGSLVKKHKQCVLNVCNFHIFTFRNVIVEYNYHNINIYLACRIVLSKSIGQLFAIIIAKYIFQWSW